jgi:hypothetical protein
MKRREFTGLVGGAARQAGRGPLVVSPLVFTRIGIGDEGRPHDTHRLLSH